MVTDRQTLCKYCKEPIEFNELHHGHNGRLIPLELGTEQSHQCTDRPIKRDKCRICHEEIFLDSTIRNPAR